MGTLRLVYTNDFGDITDITKSIPPNLDGWFYPLREILLGCGFHPDNVDELFMDEPIKSGLCKCGHKQGFHSDDGCLYPIYMDHHCECKEYAPNK